MTAPDQSADIASVTASPVPDPAIAPSAPDPADNAEVAEPPADRWVRFDGPDAQTVDQVGHWISGEVKHVTGWLAQRLLQHQHFTAVDDPNEQLQPAGDEQSAPVPAAKVSRRRPSPEGEAPAEPAA